MTSKFSHKTIMERKYKRQMIAIVTSAIAWMTIVISLIIQNQ